MIKTDEVVFRQSELFGPIWIYRKKNNPEYADEMAHETVFFSKDPEVKAGLVETIRSQAIARSKEKSVGDLAATMREAVLWTERGRNVTEEDLNAMLEGREDISEVQENPFADMIAEADAAEGALQAASAPAGEASTPGQEAAQPTTPETAPNQDAAFVQDATQPTTPEDTAIPTIESGASSHETDLGASVLEDIVETSHVIEPAHAFEPADESDESADDSNDAPTIVAGNINSVQGLNEDAVKQMSDEEFAAFMQKAQAFYDNASSAQSSTNETQSSTATVQPSNEVSESDDIPSITKSYTSAESSYEQSDILHIPVQKRYLLFDQ